MPHAALLTSRVTGPGAWAAASASVATDSSEVMSQVTAVACPCGGGDLGDQVGEAFGAAGGGEHVEALGGEPTGGGRADPA